MVPPLRFAPRRPTWRLAGAATLALLLVAGLVALAVNHRRTDRATATAATARASGPKAGAPTVGNDAAAIPGDPAASASAGPGATATGAPQSALNRAPAGPGAPGAGSGGGPGSGSAPARFATVPAGRPLPSAAQCATWVRTRPLPENKGANRHANQATGHPLGAGFFTGDDARANTVLAPRVDGQFTGTTREILRWAACKWGVDEDLVLAQAAVESWWVQGTLGDWTGDATRCAPGRGLGVDGRPGQCPESYGILQNRYPYERSAWPGMANSTAMNADLAYAIWRVCFEGYEGWLNTVDRGAAYGPGDAWGCVGRWFSGRWHSADGETYTGRVRGYLDQRIWDTPSFQQP